MNEMTEVPFFKNDADYLAWLGKQEDWRLIVSEMISGEHWDMFTGDSYYRNYQDAFKDRLIWLVTNTDIK